MNAKTTFTLELSSWHMSYTDLSIWKMWLLSQKGHLFKMCCTVSGISHCAQAGTCSFHSRYPCVRWVWTMQRHVIITSSLQMILGDDSHAHTIGLTSHNLLLHVFINVVTFFQVLQLNLVRISHVPHIHCMSCLSHPWFGQPSKVRFV